MKKSKKVIKSNYIPTRLPLWQTLTIIISLDYWNAPQWVCGAVGLFLVFLWSLCIWELCIQKDTSISELLKDEETEKEINNKK
jgi:hypothetical protein